MQLRERQLKGVSIIDVAGDATVPSEAPRGLRDTVTALLVRGDRQILLNLADLHHIDSSCLGEIVESYKVATSNGAHLKLAQVGHHLHNLLRTTALQSIFEIYDTEEEAIASFASSAPIEPARTVLSTSSLWPEE